jgi:hypothetical protein
MSSSAERVMAAWVVVLVLTVAAVLIGPLLPLAEWLKDANMAAWVQAVGSVLAILVAVAVPWWQRRVEWLDAQAAARVAAAVTASGLSVWLSHLVDILDGAIGVITAAAPKATIPSAGHYRDEIKGLFLPSDEQLLVLAGGLPECSMDLARARTFLWQAREALTDLKDQDTVEESLRHRLATLIKARDSAKAASIRMASFLAGSAFAKSAK